MKWKFENKEEKEKERKSKRNPMFEMALSKISIITFVR
jgi:hypothetical protein